MSEPLSRDAFLAFAGKLEEEIVDVEGMGAVICRELTGEQRAKALQALSPDQGGKPNFVRYQELLLQLGLVDPASPAESRQPLLDMQSAKKAMELGAGKVQALCAAVERLSGISEKAAESAEKNSATSPGSSTTSE